MFTPHNLHFWTAATSGISCVPYERLEVHKYLQVLTHQDGQEPINNLELC